MSSSFAGSFVLLASLSLLVGCHQQTASTGSTFHFDEAALREAKPWTSEGFKSDPDDFHFAVIGDRTGGADRRGIFERAMEQLNLLQPEFVINVGDLIEGYTDDRGTLESMWEEAEGLVAKLEVPFFFTQGNHDVRDELSRQVWGERYGPSYYSFVYNDTLFMVLSSEDGGRPEPPDEIKKDLALYNRLKTEDPEAAMKMLQEFMTSEAVIAALGEPVTFDPTQVAWVEQTLAAHPDVRWTFLFMHEPCWENPSESFVEIEELLADRDYTFFAGHLHYYDYDLRNGREYITMGPAGASFHHDGPGNVDHIAWVTMTRDGPQIGNIALKGLFDRKGLDPEMFGAYDRKGWEGESED